MRVRPYYAAVLLAVGVGCICSVFDMLYTRVYKPRRERRKNRVSVSYSDALGSSDQDVDGTGLGLEGQTHQRRQQLDARSSHLPAIVSFCLPPLVSNLLETCVWMEVRIWVVMPPSPRMHTYPPPSPPPE